MSAALTSLGVAHVNERRTDDGLFSIDIAVDPCMLAIEVDGPTHFVRNTRQPLGLTRGRARLLAARGWRVVSLPFFEWPGGKAAGGAQEAKSRQEYVRQLLARAGVPGFAEAAAGEQATSGGV